MTPEGLALLKREEGFRGSPYHDAVGVLTVGYGQTFPISPAVGEAMLTVSAGEFETQVQRMVTAELTPHQLDALTSFAYNIGLRAFHQSTLLAKLNAGDLVGVPDEMRRWVHAGGRVIQDLVDRREHEIALWNLP